MVLLGPAQGRPCQVVSPADSGGGARLSLEESRRKEHQGSALDPGFMAARCHSLVFGAVVSDAVEGLFRLIS